MVTRPSAATSGALIDGRAAAELLDVPYTWILAEARANRIPHVRLGRYVRFRPQALFAWVRERERGPLPRESRPGTVRSASRKRAA